MSRCVDAIGVIREEHDLFKINEITYCKKCGYQRQEDSDKQQKRGLKNDSK